MNTVSLNNLLSYVLVLLPYFLCSVAMAIRHFKQGKTIQEGALIGLMIAGIPLSLVLVMCGGITHVARIFAGAWSLGNMVILIEALLYTAPYREITLSLPLPPNALKESSRE